MTGGAASLGLRAGDLLLRDHDPAWAPLFRLEERRLSDLSGKATVHHIGSTSVPGLASKPILDLMVVAPRPTSTMVTGALLRAGYDDRGRRGGRGGHVFVRMTGGLRTHCLHLYEDGDPEVADHLDFRDALRADAEMRDRYAAVKRRLIADGVPRRDYADGKTAVIGTVLDEWRS